MKYRAVALNLQIDGHPVQAFGSDLQRIEETAHRIAEAHQVAVQIYILSESLLETVEPEHRPAQQPEQKAVSPRA